MSVQEILRAIEVDEKLTQAERRGARALETEESRRGREALERIGRRELKDRAQLRLQVRGVRP